MCLAADSKWRGRQEVVGALGHQEKTLLLRGAATATFIYNSQNTGVVLYWCVTARPHPPTLDSSSFPRSFSLCVFGFSLSCVRWRQQVNLSRPLSRRQNQLPVSCMSFIVSRRWISALLAGQQRQQCHYGFMMPSKPHPVGASKGLCSSCAFARRTAAERKAGLRLAGGRKQAGLNVCLDESKQKGWGRPTLPGGLNANSVWV